MPRYTRACERCKAEFTTYGRYQHSRCIPCRKAKSDGLEVGCIDCGAIIPAGGKRCKSCADAVERGRWKAKVEARKIVRARDIAQMVGCEGCGKPTPRGRKGRHHIHCAECAVVQAAYAKDAWKRPFPDVVKWEAFAARRAAAARLSVRPNHNAHVLIWRRRLRAIQEAAQKPWLHPDLTPAESRKVRRATDPNLRLYERTKERLRKKGCNSHFLKAMRKGLNSKAGRAGRTLEPALGYSIADLRRHLERQFTRGMNWSRFMAGEIHIDQIRPLATFDHSDPEEARAAWALTNLRPLWALDNMKRPRDGSDLLI